MNTNKNYDVIFAGGGIMACATAYNLLKRDNSLQILIVERDSTYDRSATVRSDGNMRIQFNLEANIRISQYGMEVMKTFSEEFGVPDVGFRQQGNLYLVDEPGRAMAESGLAIQQSLGCDVEWLNREQIVKEYPLLRLPDNVVGATLGRKDGSMSPRDVLLAYRKKAVELGSTIIEAEVAELLAEGQQMTGVRTTNGDVYHSPIVFNSAGSWAKPLAEPLGVALPVSSIKREVYAVEVDVHHERILPMLLLPTGQFIFHEGGGSFVTGGSRPDDPITYDDFSWTKARFEAYMWENLATYLPNFDRLRVVSGWAGLYAVNTFDGNAILGEWPSLKGHYCVNGFSGHGFQQAHAVGRYLAELVLGLPHALDLSVFSASRIVENKPVYENPSRLI